MPTGDQFEISHGPWRAVVTEVGATLRVLQRDGDDLVAGFGPEETVKLCRGQQLLPWPNRIRDGRYTFDGLERQLSLSEPERQVAIHGLVQWVAWTTVEHTADTLVQTVLVRPQPGWDWFCRATVTHRLGPDGLEVTVRARNESSSPMPFGYAAHPYLTVGEAVVDEVELTIPAGQWLVTDDRLLPIDLQPVAGTPADLRSGTALGTRDFDTAFTDLDVDDDGRWRVRLGHDGRTLVLWGEAVFGWIQLFTGEHRRDIGLAIEPMTCGPDAFNPGPTHDGLIVLEPAQEFVGHWGIGAGL